MLGQKNAIRPKAIAASPRSSNSHQFSASSLSKAEATRDMRGPDSTGIRHCVAPKVWYPAFGEKRLPTERPLAPPLVGILKGRIRLQRVLGSAGKNELVVDQLELRHRHGDIVLCDGEKAAGIDDRV